MDDLYFVIYCQLIIRELWLPFAFIKSVFYTV